MGNPIFEEFKELFEGEKEFKITSPFMMNRLLSLSREGFTLSVIVNRIIGKISNKHLYLIYKRYLGIQNAPWIKYPKKKEKLEEELLSKICSAFNCSIKHGRQTIALYRKIGIKPESLFGIKIGGGKTK